MNSNPTFQRHSIRYAGYDYTTPGAYFITLVTHGHKCLFGKIVDKTIVFFDLGKLVEICWRVIPGHFINVEFDPFIVMPNHLHGIITIYEDDRRGTIYRARTIEDNGQITPNNKLPTNENVTFKNKLDILKDSVINKEKFGKPVKGSLPTTIRAYKAAVSRIARRELGMANIWQRNYYEHIIRNENEMNNISAYILTNLQTWSNDLEYQP